MKRINYAKAPFWYFGGKQKAASLVWKLLGNDIDHFVDPMAGSLAILLARPLEYVNTTYRVETVNDNNGLLINAWRSIRADPATTAEYASWPLSQADRFARLIALREWVQDETTLERLWTDHTYYDPQIGGYWLWVNATSIANVDRDLNGPWWRTREGRMTHVGKNKGILMTRPHTSSAGQGILSPMLKEPGVEKEDRLPSSPFPYQAALRIDEEAIEQEIDLLYESSHGFHPVVLPELYRWFSFLQARLRNVRILCDSWENIVTNSTLHGLSLTKRFSKKYTIGIFFDPPYDHDVRYKELYGSDMAGNNEAISKKVRNWCLEHGDNPQYRIVLAGYANEGHDELLQHGWKEYTWIKRSIIVGGKSMHERRIERDNERLYASPHCLE